MKTAETTISRSIFNISENTGCPKKDARFSKLKKILIYSLMIGKGKIIKNIEIGRLLWETLYLQRLRKFSDLLVM